MSIVQVTPPASAPVTLAEAATSCRINSGEDVAYLEMLVAAATDHVEQHISRAIMPQTFAIYADAFPATFRLARGPATAVLSIAYYDIAGALQTVSPANYTFDAASDPARVVPVSGYNWPATALGANKVVLTFTAGYATVPASIRHAILLLIGQWYDYRAAASDQTMGVMPFGVAALLENYRSFAA